MDIVFYLRPLLALIIVCCLIGLAAFIAKKLRLEERFTSHVKGAAKKQLSIAEVLVVDTKRKIVLVQRDHVGHLLLLSPHGDRVIENNIPLHSDVVSLAEHHLRNTAA